MTYWKTSAIAVPLALVLLSACDGRRVATSSAEESAATSDAHPSGASASPGPDEAAGRFVKPTSSLELRFHEPESFEVGKDLPFALTIEGAAGEEVALRLLATEGVRLSDYETDLELDADGRRTVSFSAAVPHARGCWILAIAEGEDGRAKEARCLVGSPASKKPKIETLEDGTPVRIDPSKESRERQE